MISMGDSFPSLESLIKVVTKSLSCFSASAASLIRSKKICDLSQMTVMKTVKLNQTSMRSEKKVSKPAPKQKPKPLPTKMTTSAVKPPPVTSPAPVVSKAPAQRPAQASPQAPILVATQSKDARKMGKAADKVVQKQVKKNKQAKQSSLSSPSSSSSGTEQEVPVTDSPAGDSFSIKDAWNNLSLEGKIVVGGGGTLVALVLVSSAFGGGRASKS